VGVTHLVGFTSVVRSRSFGWHLSALVMQFLSIVASASNEGRVLTCLGFDSLAFIRPHRVTWQVGPIHCGSQRVSDEGRAGLCYSPGLCDASLSLMVAVVAGCHQWQWRSMMGGGGGGKESL